MASRTPCPSGDLGSGSPLLCDETGVKERAQSDAQSPSGHPPGKRDDVVSFEGMVTEVSDPQRLAQIAAIYAEKYQGDQIYPDIEAVYELQPRVAFTWLEQNYHETARAGDS